MCFELRTPTLVLECLGTLRFLTANSVHSVHMVIPQSFQKPLDGGKTPSRGILGLSRICICEAARFCIERGRLTLGSHLDRRLPAKDSYKHHAPRASAWLFIACSPLTATCTSKMDKIMDPTLPVASFL